MTSQLHVDQPCPCVGCTKSYVTGRESMIKELRKLHFKDGDYCYTCERKGGGYASGGRQVWPCITASHFNLDEEL